MLEKLQTVQIDALDTLFFRDGKPFSMGEETWADSIFPPPPSVIYGALRTAWALGKEIKTEEIAEKTKDLFIHNIFFEIENNIYFTLPLDLLIEKYPKDEKEKKDRENDNKYKIYKLDKFIEHSLSSNKFSELVTYSDETLQLENLQGGIIDNINLTKYIEGKKDGLITRELSRFIVAEPKVGIARNLKTNTHKEGSLYRVDMSRLKNIKIYVQFSGLELNNDIIKLGGEAKTAKLSLITKKLHLSKLKIPKLNEKVTSFKLVLTSPAYFKNGSLPDLDKKYNGYKLKLKTAIIGKFIPQGGFDMAIGKPKTMVKLVPAGSVFYFESEDPVNPSEIFSELSISDNTNDIEFNKQGYGHFIIAKI